MADLADLLFGLSIGVNLVLAGWVFLMHEERRWLKQKDEMNQHWLARSEDYIEELRGRLRDG